MLISVYSVRQSNCNVISIHRKRKCDGKTTKTPAIKKVKKEPGISCSLCEERFEKIILRDIHLSTYHRPLISEYGCSSCHEQFATNVESTTHHDWHLNFNIPYTCVICSENFEKFTTFQRHLSTCAHPSYASFTSYSKSFYCDLCSTDFETQNLYDWHNCLIANNSPCPICQRVFIKKTVLMKHLFKCTGPPTITGPSAPKPVGRPRKKKQSPEIPPQNSFKFEPETIIEQNMDVDDAYEAMDSHFMDSHFADSDNEFEANDSIIAAAEPIVEINPQATVEASDSSQQNSISSTSAAAALLTNLNHPLLECRVKLEPLDVSSFANLNAAEQSNIEMATPTVPSLVIARPTVPPLTIRIKKEVIQPGYGDEFDPSLARNIKQERSDEIWELANAPPIEQSKETSNQKKSKNRDKLKKLYKKPALLAIKIKQERMEREDSVDDQYSDAFDGNFSMPLDNFGGPASNQPYENSSLPIITQIHSVIASSSLSVNPMAIDGVSIIEKQSTIIPPATNPPIIGMPFVPIRIKSEFQQPLSPPLINHHAEDDNIAADSIGTMDNIPNADQHENPNEDSPMNECDTRFVLSEGNKLALQLPECENANQDSAAENSNSVLIHDESVQSKEVMENAETIVEQPEQEHNLTKPTTDDKSNDDNVQNESSSDNQNIPQEPQENATNPEIQVTTNEHEDVNDGGSTEFEQNVNSEHSTELNEEIENSLSINQQTKDEEETSTPIRNVIKPICDDHVGIDGDVTNVNASISPIDFNEPNANDDSLNFIDQLVHEVADKMVSETPNENETEIENPNDNGIANQTENIPNDSSNMPFVAENFDFDVGCSTLTVENDREIENIESNANILEEITKDCTVNDDLLTLSDIPDIDYNDLLPSLNATESKSNGSEVIANLRVENEPNDDSQTLNPIESSKIEADPANSSTDNSNHQQNCSSTALSESHKEI